MSTPDGHTTACHIEACLADLGTDRFAQTFVSFVETLGVDQIMVFAIENTQARCLLSWHFSRSVMAGKLAETYLDGWFLKDPLLPDLVAAPPQSVTLSRLAEIEGRMSADYRKAAPPQSVTLSRLAEIEGRMSADYRKLFFENPGMLAKTTLLAVGEKLRLFVSLYQSDPAAPLCDPDLARLAGRLALLHFEKASDTDLPPPLAALSERERSVCLGILSGRKAEAIAADLDVAPSTVITYRNAPTQSLALPPEPAFSQSAGGSSILPGQAASDTCNSLTGTKALLMMLSCAKKILISCPGSLASQ